MRMKNIFTAMAACAVAVSSLAVSAFTTSAEDAIGSAYLCFTNGVCEQWNAGDLPSGEAVEITGNGQYTVAVEATASESILLMLIQTDINIYTEDEAGNLIYEDMVLTVDSVVINGTEIAYTGPSEGAVSTADNGTDYRLNIYNIWGNSVEDINGAVVNEGLIEVTFTVSGLAEDAPAETPEESTPAADDDADTTTAAADADDDTATTTTTKAAGATGSTNTGDAGVGLALAGLAIAGAAAFVTKRK